jgi:purine-binding chemotaxis protein CheW
MSEADGAQPDETPTVLAKALAQRARCITVRVSGALYGLPVEDVQEVMSPRALTRVFHAPAALAGVTSLRGDVLPVLDLGLLLGVSESTSSADPCIVVVKEATGARRRAGLLADALAGLRELPQAGLAPAPATLGELARALVTGIIPDPPPCSVLSVAHLLDSPLLATLAGRTVGPLP